MSAFFPFELEPPPWMYRLLSRVPLMQRLYRRVGADMVAALPPGALLTDVGAGPGHLLSLVAGQRPDVHLAAVDWSFPMLRPAHRLSEINSVSQQVYRLVGDAAALPLQAACSDLAVATFSFHTWEHPARSLIEMRRILKPGGRAWIYEMNREATWEQLRTLAQEETLPSFLVAVGFKLLSWNHALRASNFTDTFQQAQVSQWELTLVHHVFWRAALYGCSD